MSMSPMRTEDDVIGSQMGANPSGNRLLADIRVAGPVNEAPLMAAGEFLFALPDDLHAAI